METTFTHFTRKTTRDGYLAFLSGDCTGIPSLGQRFVGRVVDVQLPVGAKTYKIVEVMFFADFAD